MPSPTYLVAGATGTVGSRVVSSLAAREPAATVLYGTRTPRGPDERAFDLAVPPQAAAALREAEAAFLMLPPGLPRAAERFRAAFGEVADADLPHAVFMSVQGAERRTFLPHARVEAVLRERYRRAAPPREPPRLTILRPAYFMQNLEGAFGRDIRLRGELVAPLGGARLTWVDAGDVARAAAAILRTPRPHAGRDYAITGADRAGFAAVARLLAEALERPVAYRSPAPLTYFLRVCRAGLPAGAAAAQTAIHFAERFTAEAPLTTDYTFVTGLWPVRLADYVRGAFPG